MSAKLRYSRISTIKLWRQHLGAQLPGTLPQPLIVRRHQEQCSRHKTIGTIPRYPRDPKYFFSEIWEEKSQNSTSGCLTRATKGLRSKKKYYSPIYKILNDSKHFSRLNNASYSIKQGAPKVGEGSDYQLVTPSMRLYLLRVKAWLRGITALKAMSQVR